MFLKHLRIGNDLHEEPFLFSLGHHIEVTLCLTVWSLDHVLEFMPQPSVVRSHPLTPQAWGQLGLHVGTGSDHKSSKNANNFNFTLTFRSHWAAALNMWVSYIYSHWTADHFHMFTVTVVDHLHIFTLTFCTHKSHAYIPVLFAFHLTAQAAIAQCLDVKNDPSTKLFISLEFIIYLITCILCVFLCSGATLSYWICVYSWDDDKVCFDLTLHLVTLKSENSFF